MQIRSAREPGVTIRPNLEILLHNVERARITQNELAAFRR